MLKPGMEIVSKGEVVERVILNRHETKIGRRDDNDIVLSNVSVSRYHARILDEGGQFHVVDVGSANGVLVNGKRIVERAMIKLGDEIAIGKFVLRFCELDTQRADVRAGQAADAAPAAPGSTFEVGGDAARRLRDVVRQGGDPAEDTRLKSDGLGDATETQPPGKPLPANEPRRLLKVYEQGELRFEKAIEHVPFSMGRSSDNDLILNKSGVSRYHASIGRDGSRFTFEDLGSRNGSFVNGEKVKSAVLSLDDEIKIGDFRIVLSGVATVGPPSDVVQAEPVKSSTPDASFEIATEGRTMMSNGSALRAELQAAKAAAQAAEGTVPSGDGERPRAQFEFPVKDVVVSVQFLGWVTSFQFKPDTLQRAEGHDAARDLVTIRLDMGDRVLSRTIPIASLDLETRTKK